MKFLSQIRRLQARRVFRCLVSMWIVFHVSAIIIAPASVSPSSPLVQSTWEIAQRYLQILYLNHGYHFFAPEPGESTLVGYTVERRDGTVLQGRIPHRDIVPRLLYHRHFMLTEFLNFVPEEQREQWVRSYADHLAHTHDASSVHLTRITHYLPRMEMVRNGTTLDAPQSYAEESLGQFSY